MEMEFDSAPESKYKFDFAGVAFHCDSGVDKFQFILEQSVFGFCADSGAFEYCSKISPMHYGGGNKLHYILPREVS